MKTFIAALLLAASAHATPEGEWFLILDTWYCDTGGCAVRGKPDDIIFPDTFPTREKCLIDGQYYAEHRGLVNDVPGTVTSMPGIAKVSPRCVRHRFDP